jgi:hypothetical protein
LILAHVATREEVARFYSIDDIADGNDALDAQEDAQAELADQQRERSER